MGRHLLKSTILNCLDFAKIRRLVSVAELMKSTNGVLFCDVSFFKVVHSQKL